MCVHQRIIFECNHGTWGRNVQPCLRERAFDSGDVDVSCDVMVSHPLHTIKVSGQCLHCAAGKERLDDRIAKLRDCIGSLREDMERRLEGWHGEAGKAADKENETTEEKKESGDSKATGKTEKKNDGKAASEGGASTETESDDVVENLSMPRCELLTI